MSASDSMPVPKKNTAFRLYFTVKDAAGDPVTAFTAPDSERSLDGAAFADCTNEATFVGRGQGYIDLTAAEMNTDHTGFWFACTEGDIGEAISICPEESGDIRTQTTSMASDVVTAAAIATGAVDADALADGAITADKIASGAITSAKFSVSAVSGVASGILEKLDQLWRRFFKKATQTKGENAQLKTYADNGSTVLTTQDVDDDGTTTTLGGAT